MNASSTEARTMKVSAGSEGSYGLAQEQPVGPANYLAVVGGKVASSAARYKTSLMRREEKKQ